MLEAELRKEGADPAQSLERAERFLLVVGRVSLLAERLREGGGRDGLDNIRGDDDATYCVKAPIHIVDSGTRPKAAHIRRQAEDILMCGWRRDVDDVIREMDTLLVRGSKLHMLNEVLPEERELKLSEGGLQRLVRGLSSRSDKPDQERGAGTTCSSAGSTASAGSTRRGIGRPDSAPSATFESPTTSSTRPPTTSPA